MPNSCLTLISQTMLQCAFCALLCTHWYLESVVVDSASAGGNRLPMEGDMLYCTDIYPNYSLKYFSIYS
jgi:hypothetical protein